MIVENEYIDYLIWYLNSVVHQYNRVPNGDHETLIINILHDLNAESRLKASVNRDNYYLRYEHVYDERKKIHIEKRYSIL